MTALSASKARAALFSLIDKAALTHEPIHIQGRRNTAVLIDDEDWRAIQETLYLMSIPGMRESIVEGMKTPHAKMAKSLKW
jgi:prevent-host-death family protein